MSDLLRVYTRPDEIGRDGYPLAWHRCPSCLGHGCPTCDGEGSVKDLVRARAGHRCVRCGHPYRKGEHGNGEWSPCDRRCSHRGPARLSYVADDDSLVVNHEHVLATEAGVVVGYGKGVDAHWRILTVHHLTGDKADLRWWNLAALCQRCHLTIQGRVQMARVYPWEHSPWFRLFAAAHYAVKYGANADPSREWTMKHVDELLALGRREEAMERMPL